MRKLLLASAGLCVLSAFAPAMAADLAAAPRYTKAPEAPLAVYNWTGFYIGGFGGYASENTSVGPKMSGGFGGGTLGYNWQTGNIVFGLEADGGGADVNASTAAGGITGTSRIDALGTVRGRIGIAVDKVLFYGTGGYAWADNKISLSALGVTASESHFHSGWTVGAGSRRSSLRTGRSRASTSIAASAARTISAFPLERSTAQRPVRRELSLWRPDRRQVLIVDDRRKSRVSTKRPASCRPFLLCVSLIVLDCCVVS